MRVRSLLDLDQRRKILRQEAPNEEKPVVGVEEPIVGFLSCLLLINFRFYFMFFSGGGDLQSGTLPLVIVVVVDRRRRSSR